MEGGKFHLKNLAEGKKSLFLGPLLNHIMKRGRLTEREASLIVRDIANGLHFLHSKGMSHRFVHAFFFEKN